MGHFLFEIVDEDSDYCGEEFIVGADGYIEALGRIPNEVGYELNQVHYVCELTDYEAENSGLDEY